MSNIYWPQRPDLCNKGDRVCVRMPEVHYLVFMNDERVGDFYFTGDHTMVVLPPGIPGLRLERVE